MRLNRDIFSEKINRDELKRLLQFMDNKKLARRIDKLIKIMTNA